MSMRRLFLLVASFVLSVVLIAVLLRIGKIDLRLTLQQVEKVSGIAFAKLVLLNVLIVLASTEKWRSIDIALRRSSDIVQSRATSFALTSAGLALGTVLPLQFAMATARTLGTYAHGSAIKRGTAGTLFEQSFDVLTVCLLAVASGITRALRGGGVMWATCAVVSTGLLFLMIGPSMRLIRRVGTRCTAKIGISWSRIAFVMERSSSLLDSDLLKPDLARRLAVLSVARFTITVLMSYQTAAAIGVHIPLWQLAAATPFVFLASVVALTPGGLGINELTGATALSLFGTPLAVSAEWAIVNRLLVTISYVVVALCAAAILLIGRVMSASSRDAVHDR